MSLEQLKFTKDHEWVKIDASTAIVGITTHATEELGEIVFAELPEVGTDLNQKDEFGSVESVKTVSSLYSPVSGKVIDVNHALQDNPATINDSPYDNGWLIKLDIGADTDVNDLLSYSDYQSLIDE